MKNSTLNSSKVLILLRQFDKKELKDLDLWLHSPIHNSSKKVINVYECIKDRWKNTNNSLNERILLKSIGVISSASQKKPITQKERKVLQQTLHLLYLQTQDFLAWKNMQRNQIRAKRYVMDILLEKTTYALIPPILNKSKNKLETASLRDIKYCEDIFALTEMEFFLTILLGNRSTDTELQRVIETLRQSFFSKSLKYYCAVINYEKILKVKFEYPFLEHIKTHLETNSDKEIPVISVYYSLLKLLEHEQIEDYYTLKNYLFKHLDSFGLNDIRQFFGFMTNYCNWKVKYGFQELVRENFDVYQKAIELKCWSTGTYFSEHQFVHIVKTALALREIDWVKTFFEAHKNLLNPKVKDVFVNYYQALLAFELKEYGAAQDYLNKINTADDFAYYIQFKILYIKIFYDTKTLNIDNADSHPISYEAEALRQYLLEGNNKTMAETTRLLYSNFTNFFKRILRRKKKLLYNEPITTANLEALQNDLAELKPLIERTWLEEKITELIKEIK